MSTAIDIPANQSGVIRVFALSMTGYVLIGLYFEERALVREFGDTYRSYQARVPMLLPNPTRLITRPKQAA